MKTLRNNWKRKKQGNLGVEPECHVPQAFILRHYVLISFALTEKLEKKTQWQT